MKDAHQKYLLSKHFHESEAFTLLEVPVFHRHGGSDRYSFITDIDVLAFRPNRSFGWDIVLGDCKSGDNVSPVNRSIWLLGLMHSLGAAEGLLILGKQHNVEQDHKLFASESHVHIYTENEFIDYDKAVIFPYGSGHSSYVPSIQLALRELPKKYPQLTEFIEYVFHTSWAEANHFTALRRVLGTSMTLSREIDPKKREHVGLVVLTASMFSVHLAACVGSVFNIFPPSASKSSIEPTLKNLVWGGRDNYEIALNLRTQLLEARGKSPTEQSDLLFPSWDQFVDLVTAFLENPAAAFRLPSFFQGLSSDMLSNTDSSVKYVKSDLTMLKFAFLAISYFSRACRLPLQLRQDLERTLLDIQTQVAEREHSV